MNLTLLLIVAPLLAAFAQPAEPTTAPQVLADSGDDSLILPDGRKLQLWEQPFEPTRTYYVDQAADGANDTNDGSAERPFRTIQAAADVVKPGERVLIRAGVYRETVRPRRGGTGPDAMIAYEAAPGEEVIVTGAERFEGPWPLQSRWMTGPRSQRVAPAVDGPPVYHMKLPAEWFVGYQPFGMINMSEHGFSGGMGLENFPQKPPLATPAQAGPDLSGRPTPPADASSRRPQRCPRPILGREHLARPLCSTVRRPQARGVGVGGDGSGTVLRP